MEGRYGRFFVAMKLNEVVKNYLKNKTVGYLSKDQNSDDLDKYLRLDLGENLLAKCPIINSVKDINLNTLTYYSDPSNSKIKETISKLYGLTGNNVLIANSSNEIIDLLPRMVLDNKSKVLIVTPTFFRYIDASLKAGGEIVKVALKQTDHYIPTLEVIDEICKASTQHQAGIVWICNPNNPTGEVYQLKDIEKIVKASSGLVVVDEAFYEYYDLEDKESAINLINKYPNLLVIRTMSKAYGLAGLRLGYALGNVRTISLIESYQDTLLMTSNLIVKLASLVLSDREYLKQSIIETQKQKFWVYSEISKLSKLEIGANTKANVYILRHKNKDLYQELLKHNILTADFRKATGLEDMGYVRITIGDNEKNQQLIKALREVN